MLNQGPLEQWMNRTTEYHAVKFPYYTLGGLSEAIMAKNGNTGGPHLVWFHLV